MAGIHDIISALTPVRRGDPVEKVASSARMNAIMEAILYLLRGENISLGRGFRKGSTMGKVTINLPSTRGGRGGGTYRVWNYSTESNKGQFSITFRDGLVSNILPTNIGEKVALKRGKNYIFAVAKASGAVIDQVAIVVDSNLKRGRLVEAKSAPPSEVPVLIALAVVTAEGVTVTRLRFRNVICTPKETRRDSRKPPGPGEEAFTRYYAWSVSDPDL
jgi:hypothetical protein